MIKDSYPVACVRLLGCAESPINTENTMNIALALIGTLLIAVAAIRGIIAKDKELRAGEDQPMAETPAIKAEDEAPQDGAIRIVKRGSSYWTERYHKYPGWHSDGIFQTLDAARAGKIAWEEAYKRATSPEVVEVVE
jgi:hypothetical protein